MTLNQKLSGRTMSVPAGLGYGAIFSVLITLAGAAILAKMLDAEQLEWENVGYGIMIVLLVGSFAGAVSAYSKIKRQRLLICLMSGTVYFAILLSITALFFGGQYDAIAVTALLILGGCMAAGLLGLHEKRGGKKGKIRVRHR